MNLKSNFFFIFSFIIIIFFIGIKKYERDVFHIPLTSSAGPGDCIYAKRKKFSKRKKQSHKIKKRMFSFFGTQRILLGPQNASYTVVAFTVLNLLGHRASTVCCSYTFWGSQSDAPVFLQRSIYYRLSLPAPHILPQDKQSQPLNTAVCVKV